MSIALATKGIIAGFGSGAVVSGEVTVTQYVEALREVEVSLDVIEITAEAISETVSVTNNGEITVDVEVEGGDS